MASIAFENVWKGYRSAQQRPFIVQELARRLVMRHRETERRWALRDISFRIESGETVGVIGTNGSGKSTLLSLAACTSYPTAGRVEVHGRIGPLLELGAGFHPALTGRENIVLNASLLGMRREEIEERLESIIDYSELRNDIDSRISTFSTGMIARLGFAVLAHIEPDVLLVDEALSVGDARFSAKCEGTIREMFARGAAVMIVSHNLNTVQRLCSRVLWIERGELRADGPGDDVISRYREFVAAGSGAAVGGARR